MAFTGLSAFPPTPLTADGVNSIGALGSTGYYAYLPTSERAELVAVAVEAAQGVPAITSVGAITTRDVLVLTEAAQAAGVSGVLLAPVSYPRLTRAEVFGLYEDVTAELDVPLCIYGNPVTTGFTFDDELLAEVATLPRVASVKIPGVPVGEGEALRRMTALRAVLPSQVTIGVSGDQFAAEGLLAGCDGWYSVIGGVLPDAALVLTRAASAGDTAGARRILESLEPVWSIFRDHGSPRVVAAAPRELGLADSDFLPRPLRPLDCTAHQRVRDALDAVDV